MIISKPDGDEQTKEIKNGLYESFHENGQLSKRENYKYGELDGLVEEFYESGQLNQRENYKDGELDGPWEWFYETGELMTRATFINGKKEGLLESFHSNGQLQMTENYKDNELDGLVEEFEENGELSIRENYKDGVLQDEDDEQTEEIKDGLFEVFHENGQLKSRSNYKDGKEDGLYESFHENGQLEERTNFKNGKLDGLSEEFHEDGELYIRENYKDGVLHSLDKSTPVTLDTDFWAETLGSLTEDLFNKIRVLDITKEDLISAEEGQYANSNINFREICCVEYGDWESLKQYIPLEDVNSEMEEHKQFLGEIREECEDCLEGECDCKFLIKRTILNCVGQYVFSATLFDK